MRAPSPPWMALFCALVMACASTPAAPLEPVSWDASFWTCGAPEDASCFRLDCGEHACTLFRPEGSEPGGVVFTRGAVAVPSLQATGPRYWVGILVRSPQGQPVFIIPWKNHKPSQPSQKLMLEEARRLAGEPHEKHHIFPQEPLLKEWFEAQGINIHHATLLLDVKTHRRIHHGPLGGPWNQAWRDFKLVHPGATQEEMHEHAWKLIRRFKLLGFIVPYYSKPPYWLPPPIEG